MFEVFTHWPIFRHRDVFRPNNGPENCKSVELRLLFSAHLLLSASAGQLAPGQTFPV